MTFRVRLIQGLFKPNHFNYQLKYAETISGLWVKLGLLIVGSFILFSIESFIGIGTETLADKFTSLTKYEIEMRKLLFGAGHAIFGLLYPAFIIFIPAFIFWVFFEAKFQKLLVVQQIVLVILLIEKALLIPLLVQLGIDRSASPFALGVISSSLSWNEVVTHFFGVISIFKIAVVVYQYKLLQAVIEVDKREIFLFVIVINLLYWILSAFFSYIQFEKLF